MFILIGVPIALISLFLYLKFFRSEALKREVMLLRPNDGRFATLPIEKETDEGLYCKEVDGINYRFYKTGPGWTEKIVRFLGVEGTPLISYIKEGNKITTTVSEFLRFKWGDAPYDKLPDALKNPIENGTGLIVNIDPIIPDKTFGLDRVMADAVLAESDMANLNEFGKGTPQKEGLKQLTMDISKILLGAFAMYFIVSQGYL